MLYPIFSAERHHVPITHHVPTSNSKFDSNAGRCFLENLLLKGSTGDFNPDVLDFSPTPCRRRYTGMVYSVGLFFLFLRLNFVPVLLNK